MYEMSRVQTADGYTSTSSCTSCGRACTFLLVPTLMRVQARVVRARKVGADGRLIRGAGIIGRRGLAFGAHFAGVEIAAWRLPSRAKKG